MFHNKLYRRFVSLKWTLGFIDYSPEIILDKQITPNIHWIKDSHKGSWFADPFILSITEHDIVLLVEEFVYKTGLGRISKLVVSKQDYQFKSVKPLIDTGSHLSFPAYYRENGKVYIYPENTHSGKLYLYEYDENTDEVKEKGVLIGRPLADAIITKIEDKEVILATTSPNDNGKVLDIYKLRGENDLPFNNVSFTTNTARNAGFVFQEGGVQFRPAQDCSNSYGECVVLQKIIHSGGCLQFKEWKRFYSTNKRYALAFHTFNVFNNKMIVVDAQGFRYGVGAYIKNIISTIKDANKLKYKRP